RSLRRKMSEKMAMKIQIAITQKNRTSIVHRTLPTFHSVASTVAYSLRWLRGETLAEGRCGAKSAGRPASHVRTRGASEPEPLAGCHHLAGAADLERHHDLADAVEQREESDPDQDQDRARREVLLRCPEAQQHLDDAGDRTH